MKKFFALLILLLSIHSLKPVKIESFDEANSQDYLMEAICHTYMSIEDRNGWVIIALNNGADLRVHDYEPVREAIRRRHWDLLAIFVEAGLSPDLQIDGKTIMDWLKELPNYSVYEPYIKNIIRLGNTSTGFNLYNLMHSNYGRYHQERVLLQLLTAIAHDKRIDDTWLFALLHCNAWLAIKYLLDNGFLDINHGTINAHSSNSLLHQAVSFNSHKIVKLLLSRGAQFNIRQSRQAQRQIAIEAVATILHHDPHQILQHLLDHRYISPNSIVAHPRIPNSYLPIIMQCAAENAHHCIRLLAAYGAHLAPDGQTESALQLAAHQNNLEATQALMESGAYGLTPQTKLPFVLLRPIHYDHRFRSGTHRSITFYTNPAMAYLGNFRRASLLLNAYIQQNNIARYLPVITDSLYFSDRRYYDRQHQLARLVLEYSQGIPLQKYKAPAPVKVTTLVHVPKKSAKRRYAHMQAADQQPDPGAAGAAGAHLSASAQAEIARRSAH